MKTVAITGFALPTLGALPNTQADEVWTLNHAFVMNFPRMDRCFELHKKEWFLREELPSLQRYREWLQTPHPFPIYMQAVDPEFPASVRYPFEEVSQDIFSRLLRGTERNLYYTSSFSYMLALAIYERFERIEIYGVEMSTETEYGYQKPSGELMIGVALGRGIEVVLQPNSELCRALLYAYDRVPAAGRPRVEALEQYYLAEHERFHRAAGELAEAFNRRELPDPSAYMEAMARSAMNRGAARVLKALKASAYYLGRQHLERARGHYRDQEEHWLALTNERHAAYNTHAVLNTDDGAGRAWKEYLEARYQMYWQSGARQAIQKLIDECDMKVVDDPLRLEIVDG